MDSHSNPPQDSVDSPEPSRPVQSSHRRTQRLIDPRWQLGVACAVTMLLLGTGALYMVGTAMMANPRLEALLGSKGFQLVGLGANIVFFLSVAAGVHHVIVRMTHSVVGPALVIERGLWAMKEGDFDARLSLRDGDYLNTVAEATRELNDHLGAQASEVVGIVDQLRSSAKNEHDVLAAADRLSELFGVDTRPRDDEAARVPAEDERMAA